MSWGGFNTVARLVVSRDGRKLYLGSSQLPQDALSSTNLSVYNLDADGDPAGTCRSYSWAALYNVLCIAVHPTLPLLYMSGPGDPAVYTYVLDPFGEPHGATERYGVGIAEKRDVAVSPDGKHLYLGTKPYTLEIVDLDVRGVPLVPPAGNPLSFQASPNSDPSEYFNFY